MPTYTIAPTDDLGSIAPELCPAHLSATELDLWLSEHEDEGTFTIVDDRDGLPACGHEIGTAGGSWACDCGRATCPSKAGA